MQLIKHLDIVIGFAFVLLLACAWLGKPPLPRAQAVAYQGDMAVVVIVGKRMSEDEKQRSLMLF